MSELCDQQTGVIKPVTSQLPWRLPGHVRQRRLHLQRRLITPPDPRRGDPTVSEAANRRHTQRL